MRRKSIVICGMMLLVSALFPLTGTAGDDENPEIEDTIGDTQLEYLDIEAAWFYEDSEQPEFLFISMKLQSLKENLNAVLSVRWTYNGEVYVAGLNTFFIRSKIFRSGLRQRATYWQWKNMPECEGIFDTETDIITWKISKDVIGNPDHGDILTNTKAAAVLSFPFSFLELFIDVRDFAPNGPQEYGRDYVIQY